MKVKSVFRPSCWLPGPHWQTIWASRFRSLPSPDTKKEQIELDDGDFINLYWLTEGNGPIVIIVHGLEGDFSSNNVKAMFGVISKIGWNGVLLLNRNCGGFSNRLQRTYHAGETGDLDLVVNLVKTRFPDKPLMVYGYSLGEYTAKVAWRKRGKCGHKCCCCSIYPFRPGFFYCRYGERIFKDLPETLCQSVT